MMTIRLECACGKEFHAPEKFSGMSLPCPGCGREIAVRAPADTAPNPASRAQTAETPRPREITPPARPTPGSGAQTDNLQKPVAAATAAVSVSSADKLPRAIPVAVDPPKETLAQHRARRKKIYLLGGALVAVLLAVDVFWLFPLLLKDPVKMTRDARALLEQGKPEEAEKILRSVTSTFAKHHPAHFLLGVACEKLDRADEAVASYQKTLETRDAELKSQALTSLAGLAEKRGDLKAAYEYSVQAREENGANAEAKRIFSRLKVLLEVSKSDRDQFESLTYKREAALKLENEASQNKPELLALTVGSPPKTLYCRRRFAYKNFKHFLRPSPAGYTGAFSCDLMEVKTRPVEDKEAAKKDEAFVVEALLDTKEELYFLQDGRWTLEPVDDGGEPEK